MSLGLRLFLFLICFQMEIRVHASPVQVPNGCLKTSVECSVQSREEIARIDKEAYEAVLSQNSILKIHEGTFDFVKGRVWLKTKEIVEIRTLFFNVVAPQQASFWLEEEGGKVLVKNQGADIEIFLRDGKKLILHGGFEMWVSGIDSTGKSNYGVPSPLDFEGQIALLKNHFSGSAAEFKVELEELKALRRQAVQKASAAYQINIERKIASREEKRKKEVALEKKKAAEKKAQKDYYFWRTFWR